MDHDRVRSRRRPGVLPLPGVRHPADARGQAQVRPQPRGVHLRRPQHLPRRGAALHVHPYDRWGFQIRLNTKDKLQCSLSKRS